ncbi:hypothetical protein AT746_11105 [Lacimicrobium alkaliphilum]|uniref:Uncharacterized protein n=1 Tax=Lacimicrobium alkaliphilum TaxID=1526571 RepID=A0A0U2PH09_9ALTE|nr:hypothetical protein AT746_11105 [Lacimicrobium alkaliphilum]
MPDITQPTRPTNNHQISLILLIFTALWLISCDAIAAPVNLYLYHKQAPSSPEISTTLNKD